MTAALVVMGVAGAGKTTIAAEVARRLDWIFIEGDDLHPPSNIAKMARGQALDDADRSPWLADIATAIAQHQREGRSCVVCCSALKASYRDVIAAHGQVTFVYLQLAAEVAAARVAGRAGHFMPSSLVGAQFDALEEPEPGPHVLVLDAENALDALVDAVLAHAKVS